MKRLAFVFGAMLAAFMMFTSNAHAVANPAGSYGSGWALQYNSNGAWNLKHNFTYYIKFVNADSRTKSRPYLVSTVNHINRVPEMKKAGIKFALTNTETPITGAVQYKNKKWCGYGHGNIVFVLKYRPSGAKNVSLAHTCYNNADNSAYGGVIEMNSEYWSNPNKNTSWVYGMRNIHGHELLHNGLDHPLSWSGSQKPMMTHVVGGYLNSHAGELTAPDLIGLRKLVANGS